MMNTTAERLAQLRATPGVLSFSVHPIGVDVIVRVWTREGPVEGVGETLDHAIEAALATLAVAEKSAAA